MQVQQTVNCQVQVRSVLEDDGQLRVSIVGTMAYGPAHDQRTVTQSFTQDDMDQDHLDAVQQAMIALQTQYASECVRRTQLSAHESEMVAERRGEYRVEVDERS